MSNPPSNRQMRLARKQKQLDARNLREKEIRQLRLKIKELEEIIKNYKK